MWLNEPAWAKISEHPDYNIKYYLNKRLEPSGFAWVRFKDIPKNSQTAPLHKVYFPKAYGSATDPYFIGKPFYGEPNSVCSQTYMVVGYDPLEHNFSEEECWNIIYYMRTRFFRYLVSIKKKTQDNARDVFQFVPIQDWSRTWTDGDLYSKYGLNRDEIDYIENRIKPMAPETLFEADDLIDAEFANFNLEECGVKVGDRIIYTPAGIEVRVANNNMVEVDGELYTLANFTAKFMPRNKRSVSGVCQGPRYFSYNGISLYKLKESFLGGKK